MMQHMQSQLSSTQQQQQQQQQMIKSRHANGPLQTTLRCYIVCVQWLTFAFLCEIQLLPPTHIPLVLQHIFVWNNICFCFEVASFSLCVRANVFKEGVDESTIYFHFSVLCVLIIYITMFASISSNFTTTVQYEALRHCVYDFHCINLLQIQSIISNLFRCLY